MRRNAVIALAAAALIAGCQNPNIGRKTAIGAGAGAAGGAALGTLAGGDDGRNAAIGAVIGAVAGGAVGNYMDRQERALKQRTEGTGIQVARAGDQLQLTMPADVTFPLDSADIQPSFRGPLNDVARTLSEYPSTAIDIVGHASQDGPADYNMRLSQRRADSVADYLMSQGVREVRIATAGRGETQPVSQTNPARNRRVEMVLTPVVEG
ncbi:MAG: OmpA family protein [Alphaproteobacteria bacterium]|jgi:outer membrane protein OmpA-like peptidoglycan-associated protein|nr:OmpA family protein [Alphaproteobacteria bacterium]